MSADWDIYTANILIAKIATISCVTRPVAIWMQYLQPPTAATLSCYICNFKLQTLQLHKLLIQKLLAALFAPISCNLEEKWTITTLRLKPMTFHTKPLCSTERAICIEEKLTTVKYILHTTVHHLPHLFLSFQIAHSVEREVLVWKSLVRAT